MMIDDVRFKLKDGREAVLRSPKEEDIESTLEYLVVSAGETDFILQRISGRGTVFAEFDGHVVEYDLQPGQKIVVDSGYLAAMDATCQIDIQTVPGIKNAVFGGEGIFNTVVTGSGHIWLQTMPIYSVAGAIRPYIPTGN